MKRKSYTDLSTFKAALGSSKYYDFELGGAFLFMIRGLVFISTLSALYLLIGSNWFWYFVGIMSFAVGLMFVCMFIGLVITYIEEVFTE